MYEIYRNELEEANVGDDEILPTVLMNIKNRREFSKDTSSTHPGTLNVPVFEDQIAVVYVCKNGIMPKHEELDEGLRIKSRGDKTIAAHYSYNIDALCYPLYFPRDLRTVGDVVHSSFMAAAKAAGYIKDSAEWEECMRQACLTEMPSAILRLFAHILLYCRPTNPQEKCGLEELSGMLTGEDCANDNFYTSVTEGSNETLEIERELSELNSCQRKAVERILEAANGEKGVGGRCFFIYGKAGCGKTFTFNKLIRILRAQGKSVTAVASTGIAATLLDGGRTAHSAFSIPVKKEVDVIVWDEISMQIKYATECVEHMLRDVSEARYAKFPFAGIIIVLGGDWCQFLPVVLGGEPDGCSIALPKEICLQNERDLNNIVLDRLPGEDIHLIGTDTPANVSDGLEGMPCDSEEYLHTLTPSGMPQYDIRVKKGAIVMLLRNIDITSQLCNGTRLEVLAVMCESRLPHCRNLITDRTVFITRFPLDYADKRSGVAFRRLQFPIRLAFCMTINKSQGQTFEKGHIESRNSRYTKLE
ncbi:hypothetical protein OESDEN_03451 [Oesophagostomum dentatum]|uniref:ATP-dependent DNA helicase n=1 Tax=Oesophagostomum dentatum TaxID=61180 RepID=A0A0B1TMH3_OESDE|nr:hypothetical protein OESDEN_03451 [Oesophagostomum dentatum]